MGVMNTTKPKEPLKCPRCESTNTKFCYYNNYNKSQPRHFCKGCKRYWTQGGLFRNLPIGGGRKNKLKITSTNRDDNRTGRGECCRVNLTLIPKIFNSPYPAPITSSIAMENSSTSQMVVVQSMDNYDQNSPLLSNNIVEEKNKFDNFPSSSLSYDHTIDNMFKESIGTIPSSISTSTTSSNIYNYMENLDSTTMEESTITWQGPIRSSVTDNLSNYWNWDDIEALISADDF